MSVAPASSSAAVIVRLPSSAIAPRLTAAPTTGASFTGVRSSVAVCAPAQRPSETL